MGKKPMLYEKESYAIIGAAIEVHKELGPGFLEIVYHQALAREFAARDIPFTSEQEIPIGYKGIPLEAHYRSDFVCYGKIIIEIKAIRELAGIHEAQILNYLKATGIKLGLLFNFGSYPKLERKRYVKSLPPHSPRPPRLII